MTVRPQQGGVALTKDSTPTEAVAGIVGGAIGITVAVVFRVSGIVLNTTMG
jgi:hypothetical protein